MLAERRDEELRLPAIASSLTPLLARAGSLDAAIFTLPFAVASRAQRSGLGVSPGSEKRRTISLVQERQKPPPGLRLWPSGRRQGPGAAAGERRAVGRSMGPDALAVLSLSCTCLLPAQGCEY